MKTLSQLNILDKQSYLHQHIATLLNHINLWTCTLRQKEILKLSTTERLNNNIRDKDKLDHQEQRNDRLLNENNMERLVCLDILDNIDKASKSLNRLITIADQNIDEFDHQLVVLDRIKP